MYQQNTKEMKIFLREQWGLRLQDAMKEIKEDSTVYLQQRYGMGWHDAMNVKEHLDKNRPYTT